jgi:hypothetical protein
MVEPNPEPELTRRQLRAIENALDELLAPASPPELDPISDLFGQPEEENA